MIRYPVAYRLDGGVFFAEVPDFPEASALAPSLSDARLAVSQSLRAAAERKLRRGEPLPIPDAHRALCDAYLVESVTLVPVAEDRVEAHVGG